MDSRLRRFARAAHLPPPILFDDAAWNLAWRTNGWTPSQFDVNAKNELTNSTPTAAQTYDANGNLLTRAQGQWTCAYDDANQLVSLVRSNGALPAAWTGLAYDGLGRLRVRREYGWVGWTEPPEPDLAALAQALQGLLELEGGGYWSLVSETRYVYDGRRVIQERDGNNTPTVSYTRGHDLGGSLEGAGGIGGLLARSVHSTLNPQLSSPSYYHADGNGNVTFLLAENQTLAARYVYALYGNTLSQSGPLAEGNVYRFSSKEHHPGHGLYYYGFRWYDPLTQRWANRDPIAEDGGLNLYGYVFNDPINWFDPDGQNPKRRLIDPAINWLNNTRASQWAGRKMDRALQACIDAAKKQFPKKAGKIEQHHITPKYLGGDPKGPRAPLDAAYHQKITTEFRQQWPYGQPRPNPAELQRIMEDVYRKYPLPPGN